MILDPYPLPLAVFMLLFVGKFGKFLTPPFLKDTDVFNGWSRTCYVVLWVSKLQNPSWHTYKLIFTCIDYQYICVNVILLFSYSLKIQNKNKKQFYYVNFICTFFDFNLVSNVQLCLFLVEKHFFSITFRHKTKWLVNKSL